MPTEKLTIINSFESLTAEATIEAIGSMLALHNLSVSDFSLYQKPMTLSAALATIKKSDRKSFDISGGGFDFHYSSLPSHRFDHFTIQQIKESVIPWNEWVRAFAQRPGFVMAWVCDPEYDLWQNAQDPQQYVAAGKSYSHLPTKTNGLPFPLERTIIDTSFNTGRRYFRERYIEAVGSIMWFSESFWLLTDAKKEDVIAQNWIEHENLENEILRIQVASQPFSSPNGTEGEIQNRLRSLLFPHSAVYSSLHG